MRKKYDLRVREEIHASAFVNNPGKLSRIPRHVRLEILRKSLDWLASRPELSITTIVMDKQGKTNKDFFTDTWRQLIQRFENGIAYGGFPFPRSSDESGIILPDNTNRVLLTALMREMRKYNPIPNRADLYGGGYRNLPITHIIEDPFMKDSAHSYFHQMIDVVAYFAKQMYQPNSYILNRHATKYYHRLDLILNKKASSKNPSGLVLL